MAEISIDIRDNSAGTLPEDAAEDLFLQSFASVEIDENRWNKSFPYQLAVLQVRDESIASPTVPGGGQAAVGAYSIDSTFTLPIPPEEMVIQTPFAVNTSITLGGVVEQHNGAPVRLISFSGTTGVYPLRGVGEAPREINWAESIFAGTVQAVQGLTAVATGGQLTNNNLYDDRLGDDAILQRGTGYYQFRLLEQFLENYVAGMKRPENRGKRLALLIWKNQAAYLVSPQQFAVKRTKDSPYEYKYDLQLRAWARINPDDLGTIASVGTGVSLNRTPNTYAQILSRITYARDVLDKASDVVRAISSDFDKAVGEPLRQIGLLLKDATGLSAAIQDFGDNITTQCKTTILDGWDQIKGSLDISDPKVKADVETITQAAASRKSKLSRDDPAAKIFQNPREHGSLFSQIKLDSLRLPATVRQQVQVERNTVKKMTRSDFEAQRDSVRQFLADFAARVGTGDSTYDITYGRTTIAAVRTATDQDHIVMGALNESVVQLSRLAAFSEVPSNSTLTAIEAIATIAAKSGIIIKKPVSKFAVPLPYGFTLEQIARRYLGDPNRWNEIVILNDLRSPYIDEEGFDLTLLTNASGNTVTVDDVSNLEIGQVVTITAPSVGNSVRRIVSITQSGAYYAIVLDGTDSLAAYTVAAGSELHAYLPGTVNSQELIYIPSTKKSIVDIKVKSVPGVDDTDKLLHVGGIDILLTPSGDLAITPDGDCKLAVGLTNLVQRVKIALTTAKGSVLLHPDFGLEVQPGASNADFTAKELLASVKNMFRGDPAFTGVQAATVVKAGPVTQLSMTVGVAGWDGLIPITVDVLR